MAPAPAPFNRIMTNRCLHMGEHGGPLDTVILYRRWQYLDLTMQCIFYFALGLVWFGLVYLFITNVLFAH